MELHKLAVLIKQDRQELLTRWRQQVRQLSSARELDTPSLNDHMPGLLDELAAVLISNSTATIADTLKEGAESHGLQRLQQAFDIEEVVAEYNILRGCIHDLATENGIALQGKPFHIVNGVFDHSIGLAVQTFASRRALDVQQRREEYLAFVAHDLRTPLFAIALAARALERMLPTRGYGTESAQMLKSLRRSVQQLEGLVSRVLDENYNLQSDLGIKPERREFDLWPLVESLIEELQPVADAAGTRLINQVPEDLMVFADANLLKRVLQNLIANAIKHTPRGKIVIGAADSTQGAAIECWVRDNGIGIAAELIDKVFDKGETDSADAGSTGLGLAIVRSFIEAHGGTVAVESKPGEGSTFRFSLPVKARGH
jgi:signal transduction histidine kinase